jgi:ATP-dependent Zn protease
VGTIIRLLPQTTYPDQCVRAVNTLHDRNVPFQAASTKASTGVITLAHASICVVYLLVLHTLYAVMGGGNNMGGERDVPGILVTLRKGVKRVTFGNIVDVDWSKFEVMELVDTLRDPKEYTFLGTWVLVVFLLEGCCIQVIVLLVPILSRASP